MVEGESARIITALPGPYGVIVRISRVVFGAAVVASSVGLALAADVALTAVTRPTAETMTAALNMTREIRTITP